MSSPQVIYCKQQLLEYPGLKVRDSQPRVVLDRCMNQGRGAIRLGPRHAAREFCDPSEWMRKRLKPRALTPRQLKKLARRFRNDEWWGLCTIDLATGAILISTNEAPFREGKSHAWDPRHRELMEFQPLIEANPDVVLGKELAAKSRKRFGRPDVLIVSKRFCNKGPIPNHFHSGTDPYAKPEVHDVIAQDNPGIPPYHNLTHAIGLQPWMMEDDFRRCMENWGAEGGNGILDWAQWHRIPVGKGTFKCLPWLLHAPGAVNTHEVHWPVDQHGLVQDLMAECSLTPEQALGNMPEIDYPAGQAKDDWGHLISLMDFDLNRRTDLMQALFSPNAPAPDFSDTGVNGFWSCHGECPGELETSILRLEMEPKAKITMNGLPSSGFFFLSAGQGRVAGLKNRFLRQIDFDGKVPSECGFLTDQVITAGVEVENTGTVPFVATFDFQREVHLN